LKLIERRRHDTFSNIRACIRNAKIEVCSGGGNLAHVVLVASGGFAAARKIAFFAATSTDAAAFSSRIGFCYRCARE
jgi:hypothetical protein